MSSVGVTIRRGMDWIYWHLIHTTGNYRQYSATSDLRTLQFTFTPTVVSSVCILSTSRFLVTDFNTGTIAGSLTHTLQVSLYYSTRRDFSSLPDFQLHWPLSIPPSSVIYQLRNSQSNSLLQLPTVSLPSPLNHLRLPTQETPLILSSAGLRSSLYSLGEDPTENTVS
jgi:hypothetical protein